jgi:transposase-like protein
MTEQQQHRRQNWRLKVLKEATVRGNVAKTCRHYGISREIFYQWRRRYQADGLTGLRDRPQGPHHYPRATPPEIVGKVLYLRQHYHVGPWRIRMYLLRYHEMVIADQTVYRIL